MEQGLSVDCTRSSWKLELPLMNTLATVPKTCSKSMDLASNHFNYTHGSWINQGQCYVYEDFWRKSEREIEEVFEI